MAQEAAARGEKLSHTEAVRRFNQELEKQGSETIKLARETELARKNQEAFSETHKSAASGARAYANSLVDLRKRVEEAEGALGGDSFSRREANVAASIQAEREHLEINKRDRVAAMEALDRIEKAQIEKISQDRVEAEQRANVEIARAQIALLDNESLAKKRTMALDIQEYALARTKEFGETQKAFDLIDAFKRTREAEYVK